MKFINIKLKNNPYKIFFSESYKDLLNNLKKYLPDRKIFFISDTNVSKIYLKELIYILKKENFKVLLLKQGNNQKT